MSITPLSNAIKFTGSGGSVYIDAERSSSAKMILIRVTDTGRGIPPDKLDSIFEPFTQVDASHSRSEQGTGLGLSISRDLARGMRGDIQVESKIGTGSVFTLSLPQP